MLRHVAVVAILLTVAGCSSAPPKWLGSNDCVQIGCGKDLEFYPNERGGATRQAREIYGWDWNKTSSACNIRDKECIETRRKKEIEEGNTPWHWNNPSR